MIRGALASLALLAACNGQTLSLGSDEPDDPAATACADPWPDDGPTASPDVQRQRRATLGVGRWIACPANPASSVLPPGFDVTDDAVYPLREAEQGYERGPALADDMPYSVRAASLVVTLEGVQFLVRFRETPRGMTLVEGARAYRFVP